MILQIAIQAGLMLLVYVCQASVIVNLPFPLNLLSLPIISIILATYVFDFPLGFAWAMGLGILLDHDSHLLAGHEIFSFFLVIIVIKLLSDNVLTNKSLYSNSILCAVGLMVDFLVTEPLNFSYFADQGPVGAQLLILVWAVVINVIFSGILFSVLSVFHQELKSYILKR